MLGGGAVVWWQGAQAGARRESDLRRQLEDDRRSAADNARLGRNAEAVTALLDQCEEALRAGDAAKAAVALDAARKRSAEGGAAEQANRLARLEADLALSRDLDAVDQFRWTLVEDKFPDAAAVATRTREVLARFGADPDLASVDEAAARVAASRVPERIVSALDRLLLPIRLVDVDKLPAEEQKAFTPRLWADVAALVAEARRGAGRAQAGGCRPVSGCGPGCGCRRGPGEVCGAGGTEGSPGATPGLRRLSGRKSSDRIGAAATVVAVGGESASGGPGPADDAGPYLQDGRG